MTGALRAASEAVGIAYAWLILVMLFSADTSVNYYFNGLVISVVLASLVYGIRLEIDGSTPLARVVFDVMALLFLWSMIMLFILPLSAILSPNAWGDIIGQWSTSATGFDLEAIRIILLLIFYSSGLVVVVVRVLRHVLRYWRTLRQRHIMWQLATSHISLVSTMLFVLVLIIIFNTTTSFSPIEDDPQLLLTILVQSVSAILIASILAMIALLSVAIPIAVISYVYSSRITEALQALTFATDALRGGDYLARVEVDRDDEIGQLQRNFNAMSSTLLRTRQSLQRERDMVTRILRSRRELFAGISHELRTPVATLRGYLEATHESKHITLDVQRDMQVIYQETLNLQTLIDDMFTLARTEVNRLELHLQTVDIVATLSPLIEHTAELFWKRSKVELIAHLPPDAIQARLDVTRFEQIIQHLLQYAILDTPPGGIIMLSALARKTDIVIEIKDTAPPLNDEVLQNLWIRFSSTGLGLPLVKELVEAMGGTVDVRNLEHQGRCFMVCIPKGDIQDVSD